MRNGANLLFVLLLLCGAAVQLSAQPQSVRATVSAGATGEHIYVAIGQPFFQQRSLGAYEFSMGVAQAQWTRDTVYDVITYNTPYTKNYFDLPAQTVSHKDSVYAVNGGIYRYDLLRTLYLIVCPENLPDAYGNTYDVLAVSGHCWTKQNLRSPVGDAMAYSNAQHPSVPDAYGLLYTWQPAVGGPSPDEDGYVQGICPSSASDSWHLPDAREFGDLASNPSDAIRSVEDWYGMTNSNSTGFPAYPAGFYNAVTARFEGLGTQTDWWTTATPGSGPGNASLQISYYCDTPMFIPRNPGDALSVRCVMKNVWPE